MIHGVVDLVDTKTNCVVMERVLVSYEKNMLKVYSDRSNLLFRILKLKSTKKKINLSEIPERVLYEILEIN
tara:strand:- start:35 stop:247 length:213 start_codon:yes stop_codon:yes gene_type:complete